MARSEEVLVFWTSQEGLGVLDLPGVCFWIFGGGIGTFGWKGLVFLVVSADDIGVLIGVILVGETFWLLGGVITVRGRGSQDSLALGLFSHIFNHKASSFPFLSSY